MFGPICRMAAAALVAGIIAAAITVAPAANNHESKQTSPLPYAKVDRLVVSLKGAACSLHGWPYFEPKCQFDARESASEARSIRVIALR